MEAKAKQGKSSSGSVGVGKVARAINVVDEWKVSREVYVINSNKIINFIGIKVPDLKIGFLYKVLEYQKALLEYMLELNAQQKETLFIILCGQGRIIEKDILLLYDSGKSELQFQAGDGDTVAKISSQQHN
ncbi:Hypothetical predicted protein [Olea europaea subsp. europaea]|uniref:Uncharacterized protein n=1 Tax=Olea europaea subsp. europaea TaxID=158383 RepID=A0A8S0RB74_OLEEU|nr:Hypothetical predicted protein [Olea europaea subsp. europaea]